MALSYVIPIIIINIADSWESGREWPSDKFMGRSHPDMPFSMCEA